METRAAAAVILIAFGCTCLVATGFAAKIPRAWGVCHRNDPELNNCLKDAIQKTLPDLRSGSETLKSFGMLPADPMAVKEIFLEQGSGAIRMDLHLTDLILHGLSDAVVQKVDADLEKGKFIIDALIPLYKADVGFNLKGRLLFIPLVGDGTASIIMKNVKSRVFIDWKRVTRKDGTSRIHVDKYYFDIHPEHTKFIFKASNPAQSELLNRVMNDNSALVLNELGKSISDSFSPAFLQIAQRILGKVNFDDVFPN